MKTNPLLLGKPLSIAAWRASTFLGPLTALVAGLVSFQRVHDPLTAIIVGLSALGAVLGGRVGGEGYLLDGNQDAVVPAPQRPAPSTKE